MDFTRENKTALAYVKRALGELEIARDALSRDNPLFQAVEVKLEMMDRLIENLESHAARS
jgi:hypothetical protein